MLLYFQPLGDGGIRVGFPQQITPEVNQMIRAFVFALEHEKLEGVLEWVPTYTAISIYYDPKVLQFKEMVEQLQKIHQRLGEINLPPSRLVEIPVLYGGDGGPDLVYVAEYHNISTDEVICLHTSRPYLVYMLGFTPGFPYLGGMSEALATPRLANPRTKIPGGSVGIGGSQTGIYSIDAPGGWQIIGHTPVSLYDIMKEEPVLLRAGDHLQFISIDEEEYQQIKEAVTMGAYQPRMLELEGE